MCEGETMTVAHAICTVEPFGIRLTCACGTIQYYAGIDAHICICSTCHAHYRLTQTKDGYAVEDVAVARQRGVSRA
jgi:hypothetical protein